MLFSMTLFYFFLEEKMCPGFGVPLKEYERETEQKLSELVSLYLDGDIPKENYLAKKNELLKEKVSLNEKLKSARAERKNWVEPLREWILDIKKATQLDRKSTRLNSSH